MRPLSSDIFSINWLLLGLIPGAAAGRGQTEGLEIWLRIKMVNIIQHTHQLYNATNMIDTDLNKWFSGDGEPLYRWRMMIQKQENKRSSAVTTILCAVTSLQRISQVTDDRWCIVSIWAGSDLSTVSTERNGLEQIYQVPPFLADPDHLIPIPVMMITIRNSESQPINCGVSKLNMAKKWDSWRIDIQMQWFLWQILWDWDCGKQLTIRL